MAVNRLKLNADKRELLWACSKYGSVLLLAADGHYGSVRRQSQPAITCASSVSPSHLTSARFKYKFIVLLPPSLDSKNSLFA